MIDLKTIRKRLLQVVALLLAIYLGYGVIKEMPVGEAMADDAVARCSTKKHEPSPRVAE